MKKREEKKTLPLVKQYTMTYSAHGAEVNFTLVIEDDKILEVLKQALLLKEPRLEFTITVPE